MDFRDNLRVDFRDNLRVDFRDNHLRVREVRVDPSSGLRPFDWLLYNDKGNFIG